MTRRTGIPEIIKVATRLCKLVLAFAPIIQRLYPDNEALLAALAAASAACGVLVEEASKVREYGV